MSKKIILAFSLCWISIVAPAQLVTIHGRVVDKKSGNADNPVRLPDYPGMTGICVYDGAVHFIYQERLHPYYSRLYRFQL
jgi:hypothetical protein